YQGSLAHLWSSTIVSSTTAYILATWSTLVQPAGSYNNAGGIALRCAIQIIILVLPLYPVWLWR
ncbi:hypothetical protein IJG79_03090, partial [Candidatus Saccharibacteria bacterium]|nr:hypothetical protein [Candidatus Saccharibacteria bacterium]